MQDRFYYDPDQEEEEEIKGKRPRKPIVLTLVVWTLLMALRLSI